MYDLDLLDKWHFPCIFKIQKNNVPVIINTITSGDNKYYTALVHKAADEQRFPYNHM